MPLSFATLHGNFAFAQRVVAMTDDFEMRSDAGGAEISMRPKSLTDAVQEKIADMIISGQLSFGQQVTENRLSEMFNVSKTPIREALLRLSSEGLIETKPRTGAFVFSLTQTEIVQINNLRAILETGALKAAMLNNSGEFLKALHDNLDESERLLADGDITDYYRKLDTEFHDQSFRYAENPYLSHAYNAIAAKVLAMRNRLTFPHNHLRVSIGEHREIVRALDEGHLGNACKLIEYHIAASFTERAKKLLVESA